MESVYKPPYVEWYESDFWSIKVRRLRPLARLMYRSLLQQATQCDRPGYLPSNDVELAFLADAPDAATWDEYREEVLAMFQATDDGCYYHHRVICSIEKAKNKSELGRRAADARYAKAPAEQPHSGRRAGAEQTVCHPEPEPEPEPKLEPKPTKRAAAPVAVIVPDWLPIEVWQNYQAHRLADPRKRKQWTVKAQQLAIRRLDELRASGNDPTAVIEQSIFRGWQGLFEVGRNGNAAPSRNTDRLAQTLRNLDEA